MVFILIMNFIFIGRDYNQLCQKWEDQMLFGFDHFQSFRFNNYGIIILSSDNGGYRSVVTQQAIFGKNRQILLNLGFNILPGNVECQDMNGQSFDEIESKYGKLAWFADPGTYYYITDDGHIILISFYYENGNEVEQSEAEKYDLYEVSSRFRY